MTMRTLKKHLSVRGPSSRRSSDPNASESYHHRRTANRRRPILRRSSLSFGWTRRSSITSNTSDVIAEIDPTTQGLAIRAADGKKTSFRESLPQSLIQTHETRDCLAPFRKEEIVFGPKLGAGEFSNVYEVQSFQCQPHSAEVATLTVEELNQRLHMKKHEKYHETEKSRYALKHIKEEYHHHHDSESYIQAASDLALEAEILASLQHPNIIKLRGVTYSGAAGFADGPSGYFLIIDRLFETLDQRIKKWRVASTPNILRRSFLRRSSDGDPFKPAVDTNNEVMDERLSIAFHISAAMVYLHKHSIMFRDLKPANIGFDVRGDVKIFDFGLARIMPENGDNNNDVFAMSGAGSPRYMAPECLNDSPYNLKADVYSFAIVLWEILSGQTPYIFVRRVSELIHHVVEENGRPAIGKKWPSGIQGMMESSFDSEIEKRPKMKLWYGILRETLTSLRGGDSKGLNDTWVYRRRTLGSMGNLREALKEL